MKRRAGLIVAALLCGLGLVLGVASSDPVEMWHEPTTDFDVQRNEPTEEAPPEATTPPEQETDEAGARQPSWLARVLQGVVVVVVAAIGVALAMSLWRRGVLRRRLAVRVPPPVPHAPRVQHVLADATDEMLGALREGTPRNAIVACWVRLERAVADVGVRCNPADTPTELVERVLAGYLVDRRELDALTWLYREARFSTHELDESHRDRAVAALSGIREQLRRAREVVESARAPGA